MQGIYTSSFFAIPTKEKKKTKRQEKKVWLQVEIISPMLLFDEIWLVLFSFFFFFWRDVSHVPLVIVIVVVVFVVVYAGGIYAYLSYLPLPIVL